MQQMRPKSIPPGFSKRAQERHFQRYSALLAISTLFAVGYLWHREDATPAAAVETHAELAVTDSIIPAVLSVSDRTLYNQIFAADLQGSYAKADQLAGALSNRMLLGHALASRYLGTKYESSIAELDNWLDSYSDHPEAADIYKLAQAKAPGYRHESASKQASLTGYGDDNGLAKQADEAAGNWQKGLAAWHANKPRDAAQYFTNLLKHNDDLSPWTQSAAAYWASRSYNALGDKAEATKYLRVAAESPRSFYGILASRQLGLSLNIDAAPVELTATDILEMIGEPSIRRTIALNEAGQSPLAEREMRAAFPQADDNEKRRLLSLAHSLNLASVQISMAKQLEREDHALDYAKYPTPDWQPSDGFRIDPALIYALARQESGFNASAISPGGAIGVMQLMPETASRMNKHSADPSANVRDPETNISLGQNYIEHLLTNDLVNGNLIYLLAAYNAGPGRLQDWKQTISQNDPLYFLERIPVRETRNYVKQVMTNYWIYSELQGSPSHSIAALINGKWPSYDTRAGMAAARLAMDKAS